jgi:hypothetical protein
MSFMIQAPDVNLYFFNLRMDRDKLECYITLAGKACMGQTL